MTTIKLSGVFLLLVSGLFACQPAHNMNSSDNSDANMTSNKPSLQFDDMSPEEEEKVSAMMWLEKADAKADANAALESAANDPDYTPELMAFAARALSFPGLSDEQYDAIKNRVSYKVAEGGGDVIYGNAHMTMRKMLRDYAIVYNQSIYEGVRPK